jgi:hypothetical protein
VRWTVRSSACRSGNGRLSGLALRRAGGGEQGEVEGPATYVAAVHVHGAAGVAGGVARLDEVAEALSCAIKADAAR